jgi:DNA-binding transcriptional MocR family regulator
MPQGELFKAETTWFHVFKNMIDSGDLAKMGSHAFTVYCVIKSYTNFATGHAFPSLETVSQKSGVSLAQVKRELKTLETLGYIAREKSGRKNLYTLREKVSIADESGRPVASATWDYLPSSVRDAVADLKNVLMSGELAGARIVHIERLTLNVQTGANSTQINLAGLDELARVNPKMADKIKKLIHSSDRAVSE